MFRSISTLVLVLAAQIAFANPTPAPAPAPAPDYSSMVDFQPEANPILVLADLVIAPNLIVKGPWYAYRSTVVNNSPYMLVMTDAVLSTTVDTKGTSTTMRYILEGDYGPVRCWPYSNCETLEGTGVYVDELPRQENDSLMYNMTIEMRGFFEDENGNVVGRYTGIGHQQTR